MELDILLDMTERSSDSERLSNGVLICEGIVWTWLDELRLFRLNTGL